MVNLSTPPRTFAMVSLLMIGAMVIGTGLTQAPFFRQSIIDREAAIVRDMVYALTQDHHVLTTDLANFTEVDAAKRLNKSFRPLVKFPGTARIKVFNPNGVIVWSDEPDLLGTSQTGHPDRLLHAMSGEVQAVFNPMQSRFLSGEQEDETQGTIECYVPIFAQENAHPGKQVIGVLSLYRDPHDLNLTIRKGLYLLWATVGSAGLILFLVLYKVFKLVYNRQQAAESELGKLTTEHERIIQIEKMSAMGELVGEIAHQLNNPLVGVINLSQLAQREVNNPQRVTELLTQVGKAGAECRDIVQRILRINQISRSSLQATNLQDLVRDTITFCQHSVDLHHTIEFSAPEEKITLNADPVLLRQALFNLIHNAILAAPDTPVQVALALHQRQRVAGVLLSVRDTGPGFSSEAAARLFKPFFTTRASGNGLGLSVAQHIAMKHGGVVLAENLPEGGARFSIWLPITIQP